MNGLGSERGESRYAVAAGDERGTFEIDLPKDSLGSGGSYKHYVLYTTGTIDKPERMRTASTQRVDAQHWSATIACPNARVAPQSAALDGGSGGSTGSGGGSSYAPAWAGKQGPLMSVVGGGALLALVVAAAFVTRRRRRRRQAEESARLRLESCQSDGGGGGGGGGSGGGGAEEAPESVEYRPKEHTRRALDRVLQGSKLASKADTQGESIEV